MAIPSDLDENELDADQATADDADTEDDDAVDAIELLRGDHDEVKQMFEDYEVLIGEEGTDADRQQLAAEICIALTVHATIEEEILYPAARAALDDERLVDEASIEHDSAKALIAEIEAMEASEPMFDAKVTVLGEYVMHHIDAEEEVLLPQLVDAGVDLEELGQQLLERKQQLLAETGTEADES